MGRYLDLIAATEAASSPPTGNGTNGKNGKNRDGGIIPFIPYPVSSLAPSRLLGMTDDFNAALRGLDARCPDRIDDHGRWRQAVSMEKRSLLDGVNKPVRSVGRQRSYLGFTPLAPLARYDAMGFAGCCAVGQF